MNFLTDANVLWEATRLSPNPRVLGWLEAHETELYLSAVTVGELQRGIALYPQSRKRTGLSRWLVRYVLDTNILLRMAKRNHPMHREARECVRTLLRRKDDIQIVPQVAHEF
ncbi:MAG: hypothetical protein FJ403_00375 [Verrucomicrobia bacterium]|nr:hypothetical protein [Verrucomicrobiota bacterium]